MKKLFLINDTDYVLSPSEEEAIKFYQSEIGSIDDEIEIEEIPESEWSKRSFTTDEYDENDKIIKFTYAEFLEQFSDNETIIVASTEF